MPVIALRIKPKTLAYIDSIRGEIPRSTATRKLIEYLELFSIEYAKGVLGTRSKEIKQDDQEDDHTLVLDKPKLERVGAFSAY